MPNESDDSLTKEGAERQLARILDSKLFRNSPTHSKLIAYIVRSAVQGHEIKEEHIRQKVFPHNSPESTVVRTQAHYLRQRLKDYYRGEGADDPLIIEVPPGREYIPYVRRAGLERTDSVPLRELPYTDDDYLGISFEIMIVEDGFEEKFPGGYHDTISALDSLIHRNRRHAETYSVKAKILLHYALLNLRTRTGLTYERLLRSAIQSAETAIRLAPSMNDTRAMLGVAHMFLHEWDRAAEMFEKALRISPVEARQQIWYAIFLLARDRSAEGMEIINAITNANPTNPTALTVKGLFLYILRDYVAAERVLLEADPLDEYGAYHFLTALVLGLVRLATGDGAGALLWMERAETRLDCSPFGGFRSMCLAAMGRQSEVEAMTVRLSGFQRSLAEIALGHLEDAQAELWDAAIDFNPIMVCAHLWPFLDRMRDVRQFRQMCIRLKQASSSQRFYWLED